MVDATRLHYEFGLHGQSHSVVSALVHNRIADKLLSGPQTAEELAQSTPINPSRLFRYLRIANFYGLFELDESNQKWSNNQKSHHLTGDIAHTLWEFHGSFMIMEHFPHAVNMLTSYEDPRTQRGKPPIFEEFASKPDLLLKFHKSLSAIVGVQRDDLMKNLNIGEFKKVLDVGGGDGSLIIEILQKYPDIKGGLLDRAEITELARRKISQTDVRDRVEVLTGNFFNEIPQGFDCITLKYTIHNWSDENALIIIKNCRTALSPGNKLIIIDVVVDKNNKYYMKSLFLDLMMLHALDAKERTRAEFEDLLNSSGFKLVSVTNMELIDIIEAEAI